MRIGIIAPSEIALRRFIPALKECNDIEYAGVAIANAEEWGSSYTEQIKQSEYSKAQCFVDEFGGKIYNSYMSLITDIEVDAIYLPLPPALHFKWGKIVLENNKHLLVEKPSTISFNETNDLVEIAKSKNLAIHENYMFIFHNQLEDINQIINSGEIGDVRLYRISFGFPKRSNNDFRYNKSLGGGALIDAGGYTIKYAAMLLGDSVKLKYAQMNYTDEFEVDMFGSACLVNERGVTAQIAYGMDNNYKCELEVWGSKGCLTTGRVLTAPVGFTPEIVIRKGNEDYKGLLREDDTFKKSIQYFKKCIKNEETRKLNFESIKKQAWLVDEFRRLAQCK